ncbi:MAG: ABC transporter permease [Cyanobacteria bacterium J06560_6]
MPSKLKVNVYRSGSKIQHPRALFTAMLQDLFSSKELAWRLLIRDLKAQYRQSFLGFFWAFIPPVVSAIGLTLASNAEVINIGATDIPYPAYVMFSMSLWQTFVEAVSGPIQAVSKAKVMLSKINFPREAIILAKLGEILFNFGIKLCLIAGLFIWFDIPVSESAVFAFVALIHLVFLGTSIGLLIAPFGVLYHDFSRGLTLLTSLWFFLTPVIYPIPTAEGTFSTLVQLNPVTPLLQATRELTTEGSMSNSFSFWCASCIAFVLLILAWIVYRLAMPYVVERMSS